MPTIERVSMSIYWAIENLIRNLNKTVEGEGKTIQKMVQLMVMALILWRIKTDCLTCNFEIKLEFDTSIESVEQRMNQEKKIINSEKERGKVRAGQRMGIENGRSVEFTSLLYECMQFRFVSFFIVCISSIDIFLSDNGHK